MQNNLLIFLSILVQLNFRPTYQTSIRSSYLLNASYLKFDSSNATVNDSKQNQLICKETDQNLCDSNKPNYVECKNINYQKFEMPKWNCKAQNLTENLELDQFNVTCTNQTLDLSNNGSMKGSCFLSFSLKYKTTTSSDGHSDITSLIIVLIFFFLVFLLICITTCKRIVDVITGRPVVYATRNRPFNFNFTCSRPHRHHTSTRATSGFAGTSFRSGGGSVVTSGIAGTSFR